MAQRISYGTLQRESVVFKTAPESNPIYVGGNVPFAISGLENLDTDTTLTLQTAWSDGVVNDTSTLAWEDAYVDDTASAIITVTQPATVGRVPLGAFIGQLAHVGSYIRFVAPTTAQDIEAGLVYVYSMDVRTGDTTTR